MEHHEDLFAEFKERYSETGDARVPDEWPVDVRRRCLFLVKMLEDDRGAAVAEPSRMEHSVVDVLSRAGVQAGLSLPGPDGAPPPSEQLSAGLAGTLTVNTGLNFGEYFFVRGDANHDGSVDIADAVYTLWYVAAGGAEPPCRIAADVQDDDEVNLSDPIYTLNWLFRGGESMPAPNVFTGCQRTRVVLYSDESPCLTSECP